MTLQQLLKAKLDTIEEGLKAITERLSEINRTYNDMPPKVKAQIDLDAQALEKHEWTPFKNRKGAWIFSDKVPDLKKALLEQGSIEIESFRYRLSGDKDKFIVRFPK